MTSDYPHYESPYLPVRDNDLGAGDDPFTVDMDIMQGASVFEHDGTL
jgi:hypothetical protein